MDTTHFVSDADTFSILEQRVIPAFLDAHHSDEVIRVWVPGCATGLEVYRIAMLLRERLDGARARPRLQLLATHGDRRAVEVGRQGRYPGVALDDVPASRLRRFFARAGDDYVVAAELRDTCLFRCHDPFRDPPLGQFDLIYGHGLLGDLDDQARERLLWLFHGALEPGGYLVLGPGSTPAPAEQPALFEVFGVEDDTGHTWIRRAGAERSADGSPGASAGLPRLSAQVERRAGDDDTVRALEAELDATRRHLETTVAELEITNGELVRSNQALVSMNEALQSANDALQSSKEALQLANRELEALNAEMGRRLDELDRANSDLDNLFQSTHVPMLFLDRDLRIVRFTAAACEVFCLIDRDVGRPIADIARRFDGGYLEEKCRQVLERLERRAMEVRRPGDGASFIMRISPYRTLQGVVDGVVVTFAEITQLKRAQEALVGSETRYRSLIETLTSVVWISRADGRFTDPQPSFAAYTGQLYEGSAGSPPGWCGPAHGPYRDLGWLDAIHPDDRDEVRAAWLAAVRSGTEFRASGRVYHAASAGYRFFEARAVPIRDREGAIVEWVGTLTDVHERRTTELALMESQDRLDLAVQATELGIFDFDPITGRIRSNGYIRQIFDLPADREPGYEEFLDRIHADDRERVDRAVKYALDQGEASHYDLEYRVVRKGGAVRWVAARGRTYLGPEEQGSKRCRMRLVGTAQDITERWQAERARVARAAQQAAVSELGLWALQQAELQPVLTRATELVAMTLEVPFCKILERVPGNELLLRAGTGWHRGLVGMARIPADVNSQAGYTLHVEHPVVVEDLAYERRFRPPALLLHHGVVSGMSVIIDGTEGEPWGVIGAHSDQRCEFTADDVNFLQAIANILAGIIARRRTMDHLREAKRVAEKASAAKDRFLAVLSHELRTPLTPVLAAASALESDPRFDPATRELLRMVRRNVDLEARLLDDLLDVTRINEGKLKLEPRPESTRELLQRTVDICARDAEAKNLDIALHLPERDWRIYVDASRAMQIFWNLINNAIKYTPAGGRIEVRCAPRGAAMLRVEVSDTGMGMDRELLSRAFEPFEQGSRAASATRSSQQGLGLGLAIVRALVHGHGGRVSADSPGPERGTTFRVDLPLALADATSAAEGEPGEPQAGDGPHGPIRLLLVEDHTDSAEILAMVLGDRGMAVTVAGTGMEALELARNQAFDVVVSDIGLPDMPGYEMFERLRQEHPDLPGVACSGYGMEKDVERCKQAGFLAHVTKPVDVDKLERSIVRLLQSPGPGDRIGG